MTAIATDGLLRPLSARSLVASALLGSHPPALPGRLLVAMGERFGISGGTTRAALSRLVERDELVNDASVHAPAGEHSNARSVKTAAGKSTTANRSTCDGTATWRRQRFAIWCTTPRLPPELLPAGALRGAYDEFERAYQQLLRGFFRSID